jgi:hypothetical protein
VRPPRAFVPVVCVIVMCVGDAFGEFDVEGGSVARKGFTLGFLFVVEGAVPAAFGIRLHKNCCCLFGAWRSLSPAIGGPPFAN